MADAGSIAVYRPSSLRQSLAVWAAGERAVTPLYRSVSLRQSLSVWAAGERITSLIHRRVPWRLRVPHYVGGSVAAHLLPHQSRLAGTVLVNNEPQGGKLVLLIYRATLRIVDSTVSAPDGSWEFTELYPDGQYLVLAFDTLQAAPEYNALAADYLTPVTA